MGDGRRWPLRASTDALEATHGRRELAEADASVQAKEDALAQQTPHSATPVCGCAVFDGELLNTSASTCRRRDRRTRRLMVPAGRRSPTRVRVARATAS